MKIQFGSIPTTKPKNKHSESTLIEFAPTNNKHFGDTFKIKPEPITIITDSDGIIKDNTFKLDTPREYYRGKSMHWTGEWVEGVHYINDEYKMDFVVQDNALLACTRSHLSSLENKPEFLRNDRGDICGIISNYWDLVIAGVKGNVTSVKIDPDTKHWMIQHDYGESWEDSGYKATFEFEDLTEEQIKELQRPGLEVVEDFKNNVIVQLKGDSTDKVMSQATVTKELNTLSISVQDLEENQLNISQEEENLIFNKNGKRIN